LRSFIKSEKEKTERFYKNTTIFFSFTLQYAPSILTPKGFQRRVALARVLVVDDSHMEIVLITELLSDMEVVSAKDGLEALKILAQDTTIEIILLDLYMPNLDGFGVLQHLKEQDSHIPVIILTNADDVEYEVKGLELGAVDFIRKPINRRALHKRVEIQLELIEAHQSITEHNERLQKQVDERTLEVMRASEITIQSLISLLEVRNIETSNHARRTSRMMELLCNALAKKNYTGYGLDAKTIRELVRTAPLHDIGKVGIPDSILLKPGKLTPQEFEIMKLHVDYGVHALNYQDSGSKIAMGFIETARQIIQNHHERFNGGGYPRGLKGTDIPLPGRLMAIIDVYDALTSDRVYKKALAHWEALETISGERAMHFDPIITDVFLTLGDQIQEISRQLR
jgi:putative two-component system response regulator